MGVEVETLEPGDGKTFPNLGNKVTIHYLARIASTGQLFDSSRERGIPLRFQMGVGQVIKGIEVGVGKMSLGEKAILTIPSDYAYGPMGAGGSIPGNTDLTFEIELIGLTDF
eukprot:TRINITY_DN41303_c0_g1_i1.p1 TRINITY_DN41303_c0_g1~~TRINITY_DN41303_c0_g1_i1.p1  ORF type:complete len:112 (-),score=10.75 TRINITY_DN41303_c0_g1_i1:102-437(-)